MALYPVGEADTLKCCIERPLDHSIVNKCINDLLWEDITAGKIIYDDIASVDRNTKEQKFEVV